MKKTKVLLLYPNGTLLNPPPISIGLFTALLRQNEFEVDLFDSTLYADPMTLSSDDAKKQNLQVRPFDWAERGIKVKTTRMEDDLLEKVRSFNPDIIIISILECTYANSLDMLRALDGIKVPIIAGGVFPTFAPEIVFRNKNISFICSGEGEGALIDSCKRLAKGESLDDIDNLCFRGENGGKVRKNKLRPPVDINTLPIPDFSLFPIERFYRPMAGKVYRTIPVETTRGCPYLCTFCNSPSSLKMYKDDTFQFFRKKSNDVLRKELRTLIKQWGAEYVYFTSDNLLVGSDQEFDEFVDMYSEFKIPFWMQIRAELITDHRMKRLKEAGVHRASLGLEHGNIDFRRKILKKTFDNQKFVDASKVLEKYQVPLTVNNMIGFPDETRELIFDTIELNRLLVSDSTNCSVFAPFHGTPLQKECVKRGYIKEDTVFGSINVDAPLDMPQLSKKEIQGMRRTFVLYCKMPKSYWPKIKRAEIFDEEGDRIFNELREIFLTEYMIQPGAPDSAPAQKSEGISAAGSNK